MEFENLLKPGKIGTLALKNRIIMPAMATLLAGEWGEASDRQMNWYARRAKGGAGLIIVEVCFAATAIDPLRVNPRPLRADDISYIPSLRYLAETIHENGAKAGIQVSPGGGVNAYAGPWLPGFQAVQKIEPISPSGVPAEGHGDQHPRVLTTEEITKCIELCGIAARNVQKAGFDLIEIHAHGGYLLSEFLSAYYNKRTDKYGGSLDNRCQFLLEIIASMKQAVGADFPITVKYAVEDFLPDGWDMEQSLVLAKKLEAAGVSAISVSGAAPETKLPFCPPYFFPEGLFLPYSEKIKQAVNIPICVGGRLKDPRLAEKALREGKTDFVFEGRALIADPDWPRKVASGKIDEIRACLSCNECRQCLIKWQSVRCAVNATAGREMEFGAIKPAEVKKKVLVAGAGPAGMETARVAALRGHEVILCEKHKQLGGLLLLGGVHNEEISTFTRWIVTQIEKLPIEVKRETEVTPALIKAVKPDAVIVAIGGTFVTPRIPGIDRDNVFSAKDLLNLMNGVPLKKGILLRALSPLVALSPLASRVVTASMVSRMLGLNFPIKSKVAVIGGQFPGCMLALALAHKGKKVTVIEESEQFGKDVEVHGMVALDREVEEGNIKLFTSTKVNEITDEGIVLIDNKGNRTRHEVDTVVVALELAPSDSNLAEELQDIVKEVYTIGDAKLFQRIKTAISEGYVTAINL